MTELANSVEQKLANFICLKGPENKYLSHCGPYVIVETTQHFAAWKKQQTKHKQMAWLFWTLKGTQEFEFSKIFQYHEIFTFFSPNHLKKKKTPSLAFNRQWAGCV